jgi:hypothetical protein
MSAEVTDKKKKRRSEILQDREDQGTGYVESTEGEDPGI